MFVDRTEIVAELRSRGLDTRAEWVERQLPRIVDTYENGALLQMLNIDTTGMAQVDPVEQQG